jgi:hypothetical protein
LQTFIIAKEKEKNAASVIKMMKDNPKLKVIKLTEAESDVFRKRTESLSATLVKMAGGRTGEILDQLKAEIAAQK